MCVCGSKKKAVAIALLRACDGLINLSQKRNQDENFLQMVKQRLKACLHIWQEYASPDHWVSTDRSPCSVVSNAIPNRLPPVTELYKQYPLPFNAMVHDIIQTALRDLNGQGILDSII